MTDFSNDSTISLVQIIIIHLLPISRSNFIFVRFLLFKKHHFLDFIKIVNASPFSLTMNRMIYESMTSVCIGVDFQKSPAAFFTA